MGFFFLRVEVEFFIVVFHRSFSLSPTLASEESRENNRFLSLTPFVACRSARPLIEVVISQVAAAATAAAESAPARAAEESSVEAQQQRSIGGDAFFSIDDGIKPPHSEHLTLSSSS